MRRSSLQTLVLVGVLVIAGCLGVTSTEPPASPSTSAEPESNIVIRLDGMPEDATLLTTYRVEGERFLRGHEALENGCSQSKLRAYTIVEEESVTNAGCGALTGELSKNVTTYYTLQPTETSS